jgi:hypothetical protein
MSMVLSLVLQFMVAAFIRRVVRRLVTFVVLGAILMIAVLGVRRTAGMFLAGACAAMRAAVHPQEPDCRHAPVRSPSQVQRTPGVSLSK